jgi:hypothetical protein
MRKENKRGEPQKKKTRKNENNVPMVANKVLTKLTSGQLTVNRLAACRHLRLTRREGQDDRKWE